MSALSPRIYLNKADSEKYDGGLEFLTITYSTFFKISLSKNYREKTQSSDWLHTHLDFGSESVPQNALFYTCLLKTTMPSCLRGSYIAFLQNETKCDTTDVSLQ